MNARSKERLYGNICSCAARILETGTRGQVKRLVSQDRIGVLLSTSTLRMLIWLDRLCMDAKQAAVIDYQPDWDRLHAALRGAHMLAVTEALKGIVLRSGPANIPAAAAKSMHDAARLAMLIHLKCVYNLRPWPREYRALRWMAKNIHRITHRKKAAG